MDVSRFLQTLDVLIGKRIDVNITSPICEINFNGKLREEDGQFCITKNEKNLFIERVKTGSIWSWKGTYFEYWITLEESSEPVIELKLPKDAKFQVNG